MAKLTDALPDVTRPDVGTILVNRWYVGTPERQRAAADALVTQWERTPWPEAFVSASCFVSTDGDTVLTYAQWADDDAHRSFVGAHPPAPVPGGAESILEPAEPVRYRLRHSSAPPVPDGAAQTATCIVTPTFDVDGPERQRHIIDVVVGGPGGADADAAADADPEPVPGLIAAHLHASVDGTRVLNYAEWTDEESHRRMAEAVPADDEDVAAWRNQIGTTPGVRFTGYKRYRLHRTVTRA
jgi:hypothetical protein